MPTHEEIRELARLRAATEVDVWIPEKEGDNIFGKVIENGSITTIYGESATTTLEVVDAYVENGSDVTPEPGHYIRVAWMGAVLESQYQRMLPDDGDFVAFHYQKDVEPKSGMQAYKLINAVVLTPEGTAKRPVNLSVRPVTEEQVANANPRTGEIPPAPVVTGQSPLDPVPGEEPL